MRIRFYSHHFCVDRLSYYGKNVCFSMKNQTVQWGLIPERGTMVRKPVREFCSYTEDKREFRFHINHWAKFEEMLKRHQISQDTILIEKMPLYTPDKIDIKFREGWNTREDQISMVEYCEQEKPISKFVSVQTGKGKSYGATRALVNKGNRFIIEVRPAYQEKWRDDLMRMLDIDISDIAIVNGSKELKSILNEALFSPTMLNVSTSPTKSNEMLKDNLTSKFIRNNTFDKKIIILSLDTYKGMISTYEKVGIKMLEMGWPCLPHEIYEVLGVGDRVIDEVHQHFHACFKTDLYANVPSSISLSATLFDKDSFLNRIYQVMFPILDRYKAPPIHRYNHVKAMMFSFKNPKHVRTTEYGSNMFSNNALELSILKNPWMIENYMKIIYNAIDDPYDGFIVSKLPNKKLLILAYNIKMINVIIEHLRKRYPQFDIRRYTSDDDWENILTADITVSTYGSSGTAVDIPHLSNVIMAMQMNSEKANIQILGRLREQKGYQTTLHYLVAENIPTSMRYHNEKVALFKNYAISQKVFYTEIKV